MKAKHSTQWKSSLVRVPRLVGLTLVAFLLTSGTLLHAATPADPLIELLFSEGSGTVTDNSGTLGNDAIFDNVENPNFPGFSTNVPMGAYVPAANSYSVDMGPFAGTTPDGRAIDLGDDSFVLSSLLPKLTICGWLNVRELSGNERRRIAYALEGNNGLGFDLANDSIGRLTLGINENSGNNPSILRLTADPQVRSNNWIFFAATYDPALGSDQLKYYFGRPDKLAYLDSSHTYVGGDIISSNIDFTGPFTAGNTTGRDLPKRDTTSNAGSAQFRGLLDEIKVYTNALTLDQVQQAQVNGAVTPVGPSIIRQPANKTVPEGQDATFDVDATGSGLLTYQWKTNGVDVPGATNASFTLVNVTQAQIGTLVRVGVTNAVSGVLSSNATLGVVPANPHLLSLSFVEGDTKNTNFTLTPGQQGTILTTNVGILQGRGTFVQRQSTANEAGTWPVFSANVPSGTFTPSPTYNRYALHMGDVLYRDDGTFAGSQGNRAVDFTNSVSSPANSLGKLSGLTICGWINPGSLTFRGTGSFHNQLASAIDSSNTNGFGLAHKSDNSLQLAVNETVGGSTANRSSPGLLLNDTNHPPENWIFFAVTYDGTQPTSNLKFYFGSPTGAASLDVTLDYNRGIINSTGPFTLGNFNAVTTSTGRTISGENAAFFRGLIDEFHVFSTVLTLAEIQACQVAPALPPFLLITRQTPNVGLSWEAVTTFQLQCQTNVAGTPWDNVTNSPTVSGNIRSVVLPIGPGNKFFRLKSN